MLPPRWKGYGIGPYTEILITPLYTLAYPGDKETEFKTWCPSAHDSGGRQNTAAVWNQTY